MADAGGAMQGAQMALAAVAWSPTPLVHAIVAESEKLLILSEYSET